MADHISHSIEDLKSKLDLAKQALQEQEVVKKEILQRVEKLAKEKAYREWEHLADIKEVIIEARSCATEVVWEEKTNLAEDINNTGS